MDEKEKSFANFGKRNKYHPKISIRDWKEFLQLGIQLISLLNLKLKNDQLLRIIPNTYEKILV